ncbi:MAG: hypothetical protein RKL32_24435 [Gammaproteobacteria bacterium]
MLLLALAGAIHGSRAAEPAAPDAAAAPAASAVDGAAGDAATDASPTAASADDCAAGPLDEPGAAERALLARFERGTLGPGYLTLESAGTPFLARYEPAEEAPASAAVLVVPGHGVVLPAEPLVDALASDLPPARLAVLAVQLPVLPRTAELIDYQAAESVARARLEAALARLRADGIDNIVVLGLDAGAALAARALVDGLGGGAVSAFAARGRWEADVSALTLPRLELVPDSDPTARAQADARARSARGERVTPAVRRRDYPGARRDFAGLEHALARELRGWLHALAAS